MELVVAIATSFSVVETIMSCCCFWVQHVPMKRLGDGGDGGAPPWPGISLQSLMPQGMGCHLEGQAACCSDTPTRLGPSHLQSCFGFFIAFLLLLLLQTQPCALAGRCWQWGMGRSLAELSPKWEPFCREGILPVEGQACHSW